MVGKTGLPSHFVLGDPQGGGLKQDQHSPSGFLLISPSAFEKRIPVWKAVIPKGKLLSPFKQSFQAIIIIIPPVLIYFTL